MCGRYSLRKSTIEFAAAQTIIREPFSPRYNIAPGRPIPVLSCSPTGDPAIHSMQWGLVPSWVSRPTSRFRLINARAETVSTKPSYRRSFYKRRCLIPADGWYEWHHPAAGTAQPYFFHLADDSLFCFAGLWDQWTDETGEHSILSCTIITTAANPVVHPIHNRMPVILPSPDWDMWLDPSYTNFSDLEHRLKPYPQDDLSCYAVGLQVNNPRCDDATCVAPLPE